MLAAVQDQNLAVLIFLHFVFQNHKPVIIYSKYLTFGVGINCVNLRNCVWGGKDYLEIVWNLFPRKASSGNNFKR